jgi:hypothetical protein
MYESFFFYNLTKPYPFRWFTPVVIVGAILATVLFSFLNVAATGYEMITVESSDPNVTIATTTYFSKWPSFMTANTRPTCDAKILGVSNVYYTSNTAFSYKLESITQNSSNVLQFLGDLPYYNNALRDCTVAGIEIFFEGIERTTLQIARQQWGAELKAKIQCSVDISEGSRKVLLSTTYDFNSEVARFPGRNETEKASLWWGESLLAWYYLKLTRDVYFATKTAEKPIYKGYVQFYPPQSPIAHAEDITSPSFFPTKNPGCYFVTWDDDGIENNIRFCRRDEDIRPFTNQSLWPTASTMAKIFHSTVLVDLGQSNPNILVDPGLLQYFSKNITAIDAEQKGGDPTWGWGNNIKVSGQGGLALKPFTSDTASKWNLKADPSFMSVTYLCQVPQLKSTSSLIFSVLIADFVFLQVLWKVFILVVDFFMYRRYTDMGSCQGCQTARMAPEDSFEMLRPESSVSNLVPKPNPGTAYSPL